MHNYSEAFVTFRVITRRRGGEPAATSAEEAFKAAVQMGDDIVKASSPPDFIDLVKVEVR